MPATSYKVAPFHDGHNSAGISSESEEPYPYHDIICDTTYSIVTASSTGVGIPSFSPPQPHSFTCFDTFPYTTDLQAQTLLTSDSRTDSSHPPSRTKSRSSKGSSDHVPRPRNAFIFFRSAYLSDHRSISRQPDVSKRAGAAWKAMSAEEKRPFLQQADAESRWHKIQYPGYVFTPRQRKNVSRRKSTKTKSSRAPSPSSMGSDSSICGLSGVEQGSFPALSATFLPFFEPSIPGFDEVSTFSFLEEPSAVIPNVAPSPLSSYAPSMALIPKPFSQANFSILSTFNDCTVSPHTNLWNPSFLFPTGVPDESLFFNDFTVVDAEFYDHLLQSFPASRDSYPF